MEITLNVDLTIANWGVYNFYQVSTRNKGILLAIPFVYNDEMKGYLFYSDIDSYAMSEKELFKFGVDSIANSNIGGMAGKTLNLSPLPYIPVKEETVIDSLRGIVSNNASVNLGSSLYL